MRRRHMSVQESLPLDDIAGDVVQLRGGDFRAVLEAGSVNFALKAESEQEAILAGYRRFLNALAYPVQILVRIVPTDVELYLAGLRGRSGRAGESWRRLALDHESFVRGIARERTLLDRRCYVIVPAGMDGAFERSGVAWPWRRARRRERQAASLVAAQRKLAFRCAELTQGLGAFGVPSRRLVDRDLVALWRACFDGAAVTAGGEPPRATPVLTGQPPEMEVVHA